MQISIDVLCAAHKGQALDLGADMAQFSWQEIPALVRQSLWLKSGQLAACALVFGSVLSEFSMAQQSALFEMGCEFGVHLQTFDDLGNLRCQNQNPKHLEDLKLRRPSYVWSYMARHSTEEMRSEFLRSVHDLNSSEGPARLQKFLDSYEFKQKARHEATEGWNEFKTKWQNYWRSNSLQRLESLENIFHLGESLVQAYE